MSDDQISVEDSDRLKARRDRMSGEITRRRTPWALVFFLIGFVLLAIFVVFPEETRRLLGFGTSISEELQKTSKVDSSGISTQIDSLPIIEFEKPNEIELPIPPVQTKIKLDPEAAARIAALEQALKDIANRPTSAAGPTADDIKKLLDQQAAALRSEAESRELLLKAQLDALSAQRQIPVGLTTAELAEQERLRMKAEEKSRLRARLEARKAAREEDLLKRRVSDGNVYDETEEGRGTSGTKEDETGVRELSQNENFLKSASATEFKTSRATSQIGRAHV